MDTAAAVMQIKEVMNAPTAPVPVVLMRADGEAQEMTIDQRKVNELIDGPTIAGILAERFASGLRDQARRRGQRTSTSFPRPSTRTSVATWAVPRETSASEPTPRRCIGGAAGMRTTP